MKVGIAIDKWKLAIFDRHLSQNGYAYIVTPGITTDTLLIKVQTSAPAALQIIVAAANLEAKRTGAPR